VRSREIRRSSGELQGAGVAQVFERLLPGRHRALDPEAASRLPYEGEAARLEEFGGGLEFAVDGTRAHVEAFGKVGGG
jgi:hypothetical protein